MKQYVTVPSTVTTEIKKLFSGYGKAVEVIFINRENMLTVQVTGFGLLNAMKDMFKPDWGLLEQDIFDIGKHESIKNTEISGGACVIISSKELSVPYMVVDFFKQTKPNRVV